MKWHLTTEQRDLTQDGELGLIQEYVVGSGRGQTEAIIHGRSRGSSFGVTTDSGQVTVEVRSLAIRTEEGTDVVEVQAGTSGYRFENWGRNRSNDEDPNLNEWTLRFGMRQVPADQLRGPNDESISEEELEEAFGEEPEAVLVPQPTVNLVWRRRLNKPVPTTRVAALAMAVNYVSRDTKPWEAGSPTISHTLKGAPTWLCTEVEVQPDEAGESCVRTAMYEYKAGGWKPEAAYPAGVEEDPDEEPDPEGEPEE